MSSIGCRQALAPRGFAIHLCTRLIVRQMLYADIDLVATETCRTPDPKYTQHLLLHSAEPRCKVSPAARKTGAEALPSMRSRRLRTAEHAWSLTPTSGSRPS